MLVLLSLFVCVTQMAANGRHPGMCSRSEGTCFDWGTGQSAAQYCLHLQGGGRIWQTLAASRRLCRNTCWCDGCRRRRRRYVSTKGPICCHICSINKPASDATASDATASDAMASDAMASDATASDARPATLQPATLRPATLYATTKTAPSIQPQHRGADKSLARPGRKQATANKI